MAYRPVLDDPLGEVEAERRFLGTQDGLGAGRRGIKVPVAMFRRVMGVERNGTFGVGVRRS